MLNWGFANADKVTPIGQLVDPAQTVPATGEVLVEGGGELAPTTLPAPTELESELSAALFPEETGAAAEVSLPWLALIIAVAVGAIVVIRRRRVH